MFDFISYVRDSGLQLIILPPMPGTLINLELRDLETGFYEGYAITDRYTGQVLDQMAARIGARKAQLYANRHKSNKR